MSLQIVVEDTTGFPRRQEPVRTGVPFPKGEVFDSRTLRLVDPENRAVAVQIATLAAWSDGSLKWGLLDFLASAPAAGSSVYRLQWDRETMNRPEVPMLTVAEQGNEIRVETGKASFILDGGRLRPFAQVSVHGRRIVDRGGSRILLTDSQGTEHAFSVSGRRITERGPLRATVELDGEVPTAGESVPCLLRLRVTFYAGSARCDLAATLRNPKPAMHVGGLWDLGDPGSFTFRDLRVECEAAVGEGWSASWRVDPSSPIGSSLGESVEIYQESSGKPNWASRNHVNAAGQVPHTFRGYRVRVGGATRAEGMHASPILSVANGGGHITAGMPKFWQNFPKSLEADGGVLRVRLFPEQYGDHFELQGGEQKTHDLIMDFGEGAADLAEPWWMAPLVARTNPGWYARTGAVRYLTVRRAEEASEYDTAIDTAIAGDRTFAARRDVIDEYGWRHFGDLFADHELELPSGRWPLISHYNNQYDVLFGSLVQYLSTGRPEWFILADELAAHVVDIDIYHTEQDIGAYNGGLFWHTDHHVDAQTATHRAYSRLNGAAGPGAVYGGGPCNEHNYTSGLLLLYFLTGNADARAAVLELAEWVIRMDDGSSRPLGWIDRRPTGLASATAERDYHGPGRGAGNSINACLDGYVATRERRFVEKAERLIRRCIHPEDRIESLNLMQPEYRWSYLVFLQALGKYLDIREEEDGNDFMYAYGRAALLHYAAWMVEHEVPYKDIFDRVKIPSVTWAAQDIRKSIVFDYAARHADEPLRTVLKQKARSFHQTCIKDVLSMDRWWATRPLAILMGNSFVHRWFMEHPDDVAVRPRHSGGFGTPERFVPQFTSLHRVRERLRRMLGR